jgi:hypothetical protein
MQRFAVDGWRREEVSSLLGAEDFLDVNAIKNMVF